MAAAMGIRLLHKVFASLFGWVCRIQKQPAPLPVPVVVLAPTPQSPPLKWQRSNSPPINFCPAAGVTDWAEAPLDQFADVMRGGKIGLFQEPWLDDTPQDLHKSHGLNNWENVSQLPIWDFIIRNNVPVIIEVGALIAAWGPEPPDTYARRAIRNVRLLESLGVSRSQISLKFDEPFVQGLHHCVPRWSKEDVARHLLEVRQQILKALPGLKIGIVESYGIGLEMLVWVVMAAPLDFFELDTNDHEIHTTDTYIANLAVLQQTCRERNVPFGWIIWGPDDIMGNRPARPELVTPASWCDSALRLFSRMQTGVGDGRLTWPDYLTIESWSPEWNNQPRNVPMIGNISDPHTLLGVASIVRNRLRLQP